LHVILAIHESITYISELIKKGINKTIYETLAVNDIYLNFVQLC